jgi:hypothetical protein
VFYRVKDSDITMSYLTQILAVGNLFKNYMYCIVGVLYRAPSELLEP